MDERSRGPHLPGPSGLGDVLGGDLAARLERWAAEARVDDAARQRSRERWLRQQAEEGGSLTGVLSDLAERGAPITVRTRAARRHRGVVRAVGIDFVALDVAAVVPAPAGGVIVALAAVSSVRTQPGSGPATGDRVLRTELLLAEVLAGLAAERERALLVSLDGEDTLAGIVRSVGRDVVVLRLDGREGAAAYVPVGSVGEVVVGG